MGGSHELLWQLYGRNKVDSACKRLAVLGPRMKFRRVKADYRDQISRLRDEVSEALLDARECVQLIERLSDNLPINIREHIQPKESHCLDLESRAGSTDFSGSGPRIWENCSWLLCYTRDDRPPTK